MTSIEQSPSTQPAHLMIGSPTLPNAAGSTTASTLDIVGHDLQSELDDTKAENKRLQAELEALQQELSRGRHHSKAADGKDGTGSTPTGTQSIPADNKNDSQASMTLDAEEMLAEAEDQKRDTRTEDLQTILHSVAVWPLAWKAITLLIAFAGVVFTLVYPAYMVEEDEHRRLGGGGDDGHGVIVAIAYSSLAAGLLALLVNIFNQPLLLGYILAGVLVGPIGLHLITDHSEIMTISELGLILLLFMIGLELDLHELMKMGKVVLLTGFLQFPICGMLHFAIFSLLSFTGLSFGDGKYSTMYVAFCCAISSTMIVVKLLSEKMETDTSAGRLTIGILIFQDIWAIVLLAIQPNLANPEVLGLLKQFGFMAGLIIVAFTYSKFVLPVVFMKASKSVELMLVVSLAWCFFVCCVAILPFVNLSMELAALIAGVSMATFPYNAEMNGKIRFIRDFFITLYFVSLGMLIPTPSFQAIATAAVICIVVLMCRWIGIWAICAVLGGGSRLAVISTLNLSEVSEFGLVLCSIGLKLGHIEEETLTIIIWTFALLAVGASYTIGYNHALYHGLMNLARRLCCARCRPVSKQFNAGEGEDEDEEERDIVILGFHKIAAALIAEFEDRAPQILKKLKVIDHKMSLAPSLQKRNIAFTYGDISSDEVLQHAHHGPVDLVLITIPDKIIVGMSNLRLLEVVRKVWPDSHVVVIADDPQQMKRLYEAGANYVLATKKLSAERLSEMLSTHYSDGLAGGELRHHLEEHKNRSKSWQAEMIPVM